MDDRLTTIQMKILIKYDLLINVHCQTWQEKKYIYKKINLGRPIPQNILEHEI